MAATYVSSGSEEDSSVFDSDEDDVIPPELQNRAPPRLCRENQPLDLTLGHSTDSDLPLAAVAQRERVPVLSPQQQRIRSRSPHRGLPRAQAGPSGVQRREMPTQRVHRRFASDEGEDTSSGEEDEDDTDVPMLFEWKNEEFYPKKHTCREQVRINLPDITRRSKPNDIFFGHFLPDTMMNHIATETNRYARQHPPRQSAEGRRDGRIHQKPWYAVTVAELKVAFCLLILMGISHRPDQKMHWMTEPLFNAPYFRDTMPRDRFFDILRMLHFRDNEEMEDDEEDRLFKLRPLIDHLNSVCETALQPGPDLSGDESLWKFFGRWKWKQYNPAKRGRFGIKVYKLCVSTGPAAGYTLRFNVYSGKQRSEIPATEKAILDLVEGRFEKKGYNLGIDRGFTSPALVQKLYNAKFNVVGTVKSNRKHLPKDLHPTRIRQLKMKSGEIKTRCTDIMMAIVWKDKRDVRMLTTMHNDEFRDTGKTNRQGEAISKPAAVCDYNKIMGGVDISDQYAASHRCARRKQKWYQKLFLYLCDLCLVNSFCIYNVLQAQQNRCTREKRYLNFRIKLIRKTIDECKPHLPDYFQTRRPPPRALVDHHRLTERHFPRAGNSRRRCRVCSSMGREKRTTYFCGECDVALCPAPCFEKYHTVLHYDTE